MTETCATCKYIKTLYVPPVDEYIDMPKDRFVCTYFSRDGQVMYLGYGEGMCEVWSEKEDERETKATVISRFVEDGVLYEQIIRETKIDADKAEGVSDADQTRKQKPLSF